MGKTAEMLEAVAEIDADVATHIRGLSWGNAARRYVCSKVIRSERDMEGEDLRKLATKAYTRWREDTERAAADGDLTAQYDLDDEAR